MNFRSLARLACLIGAVLISAVACADIKRSVDPMIEEQIQELSLLTGPDYVARRNAVLAQAPVLPEYPYALTQQAPLYRAQYLILRGHQRNADLYRKIDDIIGAVNAGFMGRSAAGFFPLWNKSRHLSATEWRYDGLPYAWEDILKLNREKPGWQIQNSMEIINGFPHADSIDPLLIYIHGEKDGPGRNGAISTLALMPKAALQERLALDTDFYRVMRPVLQEALRRQ